VTSKNWNEVIAPGAFSTQIGTTVPLSIGGIGGPVIGTATVVAPGLIEGTVQSPSDLVPLILVPVEVFGGCDHPGCDSDCGTFGYGLCDAVGPAWSDCNRADGRIYRVEDLDSPGYEPPMEYEGEPARVEIHVRRRDLEFFQRRHGDPRQGRPARRCGHCAADTAAATPEGEHRG
jgi:hypothetical protein